MGGRHAKSSDAARVVGCSRVQIVAHIPNRAIVRGVDGGLGIVHTAQGVLLRGLALCEDSLVQGQHAKWIAGLSPRKSLPRKMRYAAKRISDADVARAIHRRTCHPAVESIWS